MLFFESPSTDPYYNLALEEYLFHHADIRDGLFMLWQNDNTLVVGKYQNTAAEINAEFVKRHSTKVVRRSTGGGAVYHDMGNVNYTYMRLTDHPEEINFRDFMEPLVTTLHRMGLKAEFNSRNDLAIDGKKFSGNSQKTEGNRVLHHGTLLFSSNLSFVAGALQPREDKYIDKGIPSVRSRVTNLVDYLETPVSVEEFKRRLTEGIFAERAKKRVVLGSEAEAAIRTLRDEKYGTWEWNYGRSPAYAVTKYRKFPAGALEFQMDTEQPGKIKNISIHGDFFGSGDIRLLEKRLEGCPLRKKDLLGVLADFPVSYYIQGLTAAELAGAIVE